MSDKKETVTRNEYAVCPECERKDARVVDQSNVRALGTGKSNPLPQRMLL